MPTSDSTPVTIFWFRRDLRLHDNHGLHRALQSSDNVIPLFIFDPEILGDLQDRDDRRVTFIYQALEDLNRRLREQGKALTVLYGRPVEVFDALCDRFPVSHVYANHDYEPYAEERDEKVRKLLSSRGVGMHTFKDHVVHERAEVTKADGKPYTVYTPYGKAWRARLAQTGLPRYASEELLGNLHGEAVSPFPTLESMGFRRAVFPLPAQDPKTDIVRKYHEQRNFPAVDGTTEIGVHLRFGTVSVRDMVRIGQSLNDTWLSELIWREFFSMILSNFPHVVTQSFRPDYDDVRWRNDEEEFQAWCEGRTGFPLVDAGMRQLVATGHMHNRVRMVVASFLCKDLLVDWRKGEAFFARYLLDYDLASNNGNWQWAAGCGCDAAPYFRVFNPHEQLKKFDPELLYVRRWLSDEEISFPKPIVDHAAARVRALKVYKEALRGNESF
ncbi:MAG: cryptochrome/photolyase family protein [Candidatus Kapaibacterium sp.]